MPRREYEVERLSISLPREDVATLRELAELTGRPISHIVGQFCKPELEISRQILSLGRSHDPLLWDTIARLLAEPRVRDPERSLASPAAIDRPSSSVDSGEGKPRRRESDAE